LTAPHRSNEFHISVKELLAENTSKSVVALFVVNFAHKESNQTPEWKTALKQNAMHAPVPVPHLTSRQLVVEHKHRLKSVVRILMQHAHAVTKHNPTVLLVKPHDHLPLIASQQIVLTIHHQHDELTQQNESLLIAEHHRQQTLLLAVDRLIHADQRAQMTVGVLTEQTVRHRTEWAIPHNEFKRTVV
jgi:hypothetical protein